MTRDLVAGNWFIWKGAKKAEFSIELQILAFPWINRDHSKWLPEKTLNCFPFLTHLTADRDVIDEHKDNPLRGSVMPYWLRAGSGESQLSCACCCLIWFLLILNSWGWFHPYLGALGHHHSCCWKMLSTSRRESRESWWELETLSLSGSFTEGGIHDPFVCGAMTTLHNKEFLCSG